jgi:hypothetical protein
VTAVSTGERNTYTLALEREVLKMTQRRRVYYNAEQRNLMWDRWQKGARAALKKKLIKQPKKLPRELYRSGSDPAGVAIVRESTFRWRCIS